MTSNVGDVVNGPLFFPTPAVAEARPPVAPAMLADRVAAVPGLTRAALETATEAGLRGRLQQLLGALQNKSNVELEHGERSGDGSLAITSHIAVWLIGKVTTAYGHKLISLSNVSDRDTLRSVAGVSRLLRAAILSDLRADGVA